MLRQLSRFVIVIGALVAVSTSARAERGNSDVQLDGQTIDMMVGDFMRDHEIPGMTLAIVQAPYISRLVGYGVSDIDKRLLASPKTLWNVGQMTQAYTAVAVMQLVEAGKLSLDEPLDKHISDLPEAWREISLRQLMAHASGLPDYSKQAMFQPAAEYRPEEVIALVKDLPLTSLPGTRVANSATDFFLLGLVIERASGMSYEEYIIRNQIERLNLKNTCFASGFAERKTEVEAKGGKHRKFLTDRPYIDPTEVAVGSTTTNGKSLVVPANSQSGSFANGAVWASAEDISLWDIGLAGNMLINKKENRDFLFHAVKLGDGSATPSHCGWRFLGHKGAMDIRGDVPGFSCHLSRFTDPSELLCVTLCCNKGGVELSELARRIAGAFDRKIAPPVSPQLMKCMESAYSAKATADRLVDAFQSQGVGLSTRISLNTNAAKAGSELPLTEQLTFESTEVRLQLMLRNPLASMALQTTILVWQEPSGEVWLGTRDTTEAAAASGINGEGEALQQIENETEAAMAYAAGACL